MISINLIILAIGLYSIATTTYIIYQTFRLKRLSVDLEDVTLCNKMYKECVLSSSFEHTRESIPMTYPN